MKKIRESKVSKFLVYYFSIMIVSQVIAPTSAYALTSGPTQPEFNSFTPIGTSDMVDLDSGNYNYNIPIMDVGGYPINLSYNGGVTMDQEASWVGLGWNLNVGQIERQVRGLPDDFNGDEITYENDMRDNVTIGMNLAGNAAVFGTDAIKLGVGLGIEYNNYQGISFKPSYGVNFELSDNVSVGMNFSSSVDEGASVSPSVSISDKGKTGDALNLGSSLSLGFNSRKGIENLNLSASISKDYVNKNGGNKSAGLSSLSGSISFNNQSYTPSKRIGYENTSFTYSAAVGGEVFGAEGQAQVTGYGSYQKIHQDYKIRKEKAFGYENTHYKGTQSGILDFNREKEATVSQRTVALPITNYTYDIYNIEGQGVSGMFRPYRSQVSNVYNDNVVDYGSGKNFGVEIGLGQLVHGSMDFKTTPSVSVTGPWITNNNVLPYFKESSKEINRLDYEPVAFKLVGSMTIDTEQNLYQNKIQNEKALSIGIIGGNKNGSTKKYYYDKAGIPFLINSKIKKENRFIRNQVIQKIKAKDLSSDAFITRNSNAKDHHTAGMKVLQTDGTSYVYGQTAYNIEKIEATFDVSKHTGDNSTGLVNYASNDIRGHHDDTKNSDMFINRITTPAYAHSYLITSILSSDYEDVDGNGPSKNDLGSYTKFDYESDSPSSIYQWRIPFQAQTATYNPGLNSKKGDQKGTYIYGKKQLKYLNKIVTKTHVAFFDLENRKDAVGVAGEHGGIGTGRMKKIKTIRLYSLPEVTNSSGMIVDPGIGGIVKPIKTAHFIYNYSLCKGIPNNEKQNNVNSAITASETSNNGGKLTLEKVYFTYRNSNMGKYTPYVFDYGTDNTVNNPNYNMKGFDIWGNYKLNQGTGGVNDSTPTTTEFPFVNQKSSEPAGSSYDDLTNKNAQRIADDNVQAWNLKSVTLPSGGKIDIEIESDDYQFVQNKKVMQQYKVIGCGNTPNSPDTNTNLYSGNDHVKYLYVKVSNEAISGYTSQNFINDYLSENIDKYIQFKFLLNMRDDNAEQKEYISGYFKKDKAVPIVITSNPTSGTIAAIPMEFTFRGGKENGDAQVNPISKTGWGFGRTHLNRIVYGSDDDPGEKDFETIVNNLASSIERISELFTGPNLALQNKGCARTFNPDKSWIRLETKGGVKFGGGLRVKSIKLSDNWSNMLSSGGGTQIDMNYGQTYSYDDDNLKSSGVATFEPNNSSENPFVEPVFPGGGNNANFNDFAENVSAPRENNYIEKPFGENFFPSPTVTYSKVTVENLDRDNLKKHATGKVITRHYTTYDFPTKVEFTNLQISPDITSPNIISNMLSNGNVTVRNHLTASQGFSIETNDMNGKVKSQEVYGEDQVDAISKVIYKYNIDANGNLDNNLITIDSKGNIERKLIGLDYDMINDFNQNFSSSSVSGMDANLAAFLIPMAPAPIPAYIPTVFPKNSYNENLLRTAVTTKHIHKTGILVEKIAYDLGSTVSTKNLAWDAQSGEVLLTETTNEYNDKYYSFNYPAYWMYTGMGNASQNIGIEGYINRKKSCQFDPSPYFKIFKTSNTSVAFESNISDYFHVGDELMLYLNADTQENYIRVWVMEINSAKNGLLLMDANGNYLDDCGTNEFTYKFKIVRSGYRNLQSASMASVTSMINPLFDNLGVIKSKLDDNIFAFSGSGFNPRIINASAVVYNDFWKPQNEANLGIYPTLPGMSYEASGEVKHPYKMDYNPYLWNIKGDWKAETSYAYLAGRKSGNGVINNPRNEGFYTKFNSFYKLVNGQWLTNKTNWTYASSITQYSPYGSELENKDALNRYSAAQYGYNYTLPTAVASNSKYNEIGFEGFEESITSNKKHFEFHGINTNLNISDVFSHTGRKSVKVTKTNSVQLKAGLQPTKVIAQERDCFYQCSEFVSIQQGPSNAIMILDSSPVSCIVHNNEFPNIPLELRGYTEYTISPACPNLELLVSNDFEDESVKVTYTQISSTNIRISICGGWFNTAGVTESFRNVPIFVNGAKINLKLVAFATYYPSENQTHGARTMNITCE